MEQIEIGDIVEVKKLYRGARKPYEMVVEVITQSRGIIIDHYGTGLRRVTSLTTYKLRCPHCGEEQMISDTEAEITLVRKGEPGCS